MNLLDKQKILKEAEITLKNEFIGVDHIIEELLDMITPYYYSSNMLRKPLVINLWGLTGTGKTSLIERLMTLLDTNNKFCKLDLGEKTHSLKYEIEKKLEKLDCEDPIFLFDEFQSARTIDEGGSEIKDNPVRIMWEMIDTGVITFMDYNYISFTVQDYIKLIELIKESDVLIKDGKVVKGDYIYNSAYTYIFDCRRDKKEDKNDNGFFFINEDHWINLYKLCPEAFGNLPFFEKDVFIQTMKGMDIEKLDELFKKLKRSISLTKSFKFTKALIFCIGNLDEAYSMSRDLNPDTDPDVLHKRSLNITVPDIKKCLLSRFRAEQIARLGNNHLIYPALNKKDYRKLIKHYLKKFKEEWYSENNISLSYNADDSVVDLVYNEGVFPSQGVRPILSTIYNLILPVIAKSIVEFQSVCTNKIKDVKFTADNDKDLALITITDSKRKKFNFEYKLKLKVHSLRRPKNQEQLFITSVHEAGHVITSALLANLLPDRVSVCTASADSEGFVQLQFPEIHTKDLYMKHIQVLLGGLVAEKLFIGDNMAGPGVRHDLEVATTKALTMTKRVGMGNSPFVLNTGKEQGFDMSGLHDYESEEKISEQYLRECYAITEECLKNNVVLLQELVNALTKKYTLDSKEIEKIVTKYAVGKVEFKDPDNYYNISSIINTNINQLKITNGERVL